MRGIIKIYTDGGARGNPGPSAGAFVVILDGRIIHKNALYFGVRTNNEAEYGALIAALSWLSKNKTLVKNKAAIIYMDSELVVKQLTGLYKIKNNNLKILANKVKTLEKKIEGEVFYKSIVREKNRLADTLLNKKIDEKLG